MLKFHFNYK